MSPPIQFQEEADIFLSEAEHSLLALEKNTKDSALLESTVNALRTLHGVANLFNLDNMNLILAMVADSFDNESMDEVPEKLLGITLTLIDKIRSHDQGDFSSQESHNIMADFSQFTDKIDINLITKKQARDVRILVVDDELVNRTLLVEFIKTFHGDIDIVAVDSASEAIFHYLTDDFDLVFLDIMMPEVDGNHFIAIVEKNRKLGNITKPANIIVQTAVQSLTELLNIVQNDCILEVIRKPIHRGRIATCIERYCTPFGGDTTQKN